jgi:hypothetical protein
MLTAVFIIVFSSFYYVYQYHYRTYIADIPHRLFTNVRTSEFELDTAFVITGRSASFSPRPTNAPIIRTCASALSLSSSAEKRSVTPSPLSVTIMSIAMPLVSQSSLPITSISHSEQNNKLYRRVLDTYREFKEQLPYQRDQRFSFLLNTVSLNPRQVLT